MNNLVKITGGMPTPDMAADLADAIRAICYEKADGVALAVVIGVLEIVKSELIASAS